MTDKPTAKKQALSADWFARGILTRLGDSFDRWTGRQWTPSSGLAQSELIERIKRLLDSEAKEISGKGMVVPHQITIKIQQENFSEVLGNNLETARHELLPAVVDHINDSLYYTFAPVTLEIKPDLFVEGTKLYASFGEFIEEGDVEQNVTVPALDVSEAISDASTNYVASAELIYVARYEIAGNAKERTLNFPAGQRRSIGRSGTNDLALDDSSVSNLHASLAVDKDGNLSVADTGSTNGTFVNNERIAYGKAVRLADGDRVKFGVVEVTFEPVPQPAAPDEENIGEPS